MVYTFLCNQVLALIVTGDEKKIAIWSTQKKFYSLWIISGKVQFLRKCY